MTAPQSLRPYMPPEAPLAHPPQNLRAQYRDAEAPPVETPGARRWRLALIATSGALTLAVVAAFGGWFASDGFSLPELALIAVIAASIFWIALSVATVILGSVIVLRRTPNGRSALAAQGQAPDVALEVALLIPICNEVPGDVFGNAAAMRDALGRLSSRHRFALYVLSDTTDPELAENELRAMAALQIDQEPRARLFYRRRAQNTDRKVGNIADWIGRWGGAHDAMVVLDADSLMSGEALVALTDELAADASAGLIQSFPQVIEARTVFGRAQQFAATVYGALMAEGLAAWSDREGNYWGHNAIIRIQAFAACAGLPKLPQTGPLVAFRGVIARRNTAWAAAAAPASGALILSHDFVEAGLLRRAGWGVRFCPNITGSYEQAPATLIDYIRRDARWCRGNLQHLRLLGAGGFHPVSRFHLLNGAVGYLLSPLWALLICLWALLGVNQTESVLHYFTGTDPQVAWPDMAPAQTGLLLAMVYGLLLAPRLLSALFLRRIGLVPSDLGGRCRFAVSALAEITLSVLYAPILMVHQTRTVITAVLGVRADWTPQTRGAVRQGWRQLLRFHWFETLLGGALALGLATGLVSPWLTPIAVSLALAVPLSRLSGRVVDQTAGRGLTLATPQQLTPAPILRAARAHRADLQAQLDRPRDAAE